jgi:hypothetical protein
MSGYVAHEIEHHSGGARGQRATESSLDEPAGGGDQDEQWPRNERF